MLEGNGLRQEVGGEGGIANSLCLKTVWASSPLPHFQKSLLISEQEKNPQHVSLITNCTILLAFIQSLANCGLGQFVHLEKDQDVIHGFPDIKPKTVRIL